MNAQTKIDAPVHRFQNQERRSNLRWCSLNKRVVISFQLTYAHNKFPRLERGRGLKLPALFFRLTKKKEAAPGFRWSCQSSKTGLRHQRVRCREEAN